MVKKTSIAIALQYQTQSFDLQVPRYVTTQRLEILIALNLEQLKITLPQQWHLRLQGKQLRLAPDQLLANYPVSDGDQFIIQEVVGNKHDTNQ